MQPAGGLRKLRGMEELNYAAGTVATITVNRPKALNALNRVVLEGLVQNLSEIRNDRSVRVLIITGAGDRAFVAGADIAAMAEMGVNEGLEFGRLGHAVMTAIEDLPIPVIAAVNGFALGGGLELALACDLIVASEKARFGQPEINLGIIPGFGGTQRLPHRIGHARARELILTGEMFDAKTGLEWGVVNQVVAPEQLLDEARKLAEKIASKSGFALRQAKAALRAASTMEEDAGLRFEQNAFGVCFGSEDRVEGMKAFLGKREAKWQHK
ncbi:MAG TPA: enoyl-CoA hydratase-related protein [Candidatus Binataceae bacterium]|nr:enoyl-CoA hydratase-related protein [Candidatus Binataceae bacterium]